MTPMGRMYAPDPFGADSSGEGGGRPAFPRSALPLWLTWKTASPRTAMAGHHTYSVAAIRLPPPSGSPAAAAPRKRGGVLRGHARPFAHYYVLFFLGFAEFPRLLALLGLFRYVPSVRRRLP